MTKLILICRTCNSSGTVRNVNFEKENVRVEQMTNYDRLILDITTDGTITPEKDCCDRIIAWANKMGEIPIICSLLSRSDKIEIPRLSNCFRHRDKAFFTTSKILSCITNIEFNIKLLILIDIFCK